MIPGDHGKPRPAVIIQTDGAVGIETLIICMVTSDREEPWSFRVDLPVSAANGLIKPSRIMTDKMFTVKKAKCGKVFGNIGPDALAELNTAIAIITGLAD